MSVLLLANFASYLDEVLCLRTRLAQSGCDLVLLDTSPTSSADFPHLTLRSRQSGSGQLQTEAHNGPALIRREVSQLVQRLQQQNPLQGVLIVGDREFVEPIGSALAALPHAIPKLLVLTPPVSSQEPLVGLGDLQVFQSVAGVSAKNRAGRLVLTRAADALVGMISSSRLVSEPQLPLVAVSWLDVTAAAAEQARIALSRRGLEGLLVEVSSVGAQSLEWFARAGALNGLLDLTVANLADEMLGGQRAAGPDRLTAGAVQGLPQVISLGGLDAIQFSSEEKVPAERRERCQRFGSAVLVRTTPQENDDLGREIAYKASASSGPTVVLVPRGGLSKWDRPGEPFWWPEANEALFQSLRNWMSPHVQLIESDYHILEPEFTELAVDLLAQGLASQSTGAR